MLESYCPTSITPVIDAQQREIDHWLSRIKRQEARLDGMAMGPKYRRAEKELNRMLDHVDALNDELLRMDVVF